MVACGVWAIILGLVTNSFIGDFIPRWIYGDTTAMIPTTIPSINSFAHPENILMIAILIGVLHINMGLLFGAYNNIVRGDVGEALGAQIVWFVIEAGIILAAIAFMLLGGGILLYVGSAVFAAGLIMLIYLNGLQFMDLSGFLGNVLSYARLLALCLSTGGIATPTVNIFNWYRWRNDSCNWNNTCTNNLYWRANCKRCLPDIRCVHKFTSFALC